MTVARRERMKVRIPFTGAPRGTCRWCGEAILKPDGTQDMRRRWHGEPCYREFFRLQDFAWDPRRAVARRDRGTCSACGTFTGGRGYRRTGHLWHVDHVVPLWAGGEHVLENTWTLCPDCHRIKTAAEATLRSGQCRLYRRSVEKDQADLGSVSHAEAWSRFLARYLPPADPAAAMDYWRECLCPT